MLNATSRYLKIKKSVENPFSSWMISRLHGHYDSVHKLFMSAQPYTPALVRLQLGWPRLPAAPFTAPFSTASRSSNDTRPYEGFVGDAGCDSVCLIHV